MTARTYLNPVYGRDFPDPFVLKYCGDYWAYGTGFWDDGRVFGVLRSRDLVQWSAVGGAMEPLPGHQSCYWAPEVTYDNGRFYLYYSAGDGNLMHLRVAVATQPAGPFVDSGRRLTNEPFAIDAHVFTDEDGRRYLFYATDFLDHSYIGTGAVYDQLLDPYRLAGRPRPVTRACYDWQVYDPHRVEKGGVRWHTVEGSFVLKRKGRYYHMFSGGNWQNPSYGVGYATSDHLERPNEWPQACDGERVQPILRTAPGQVIGPGHNSVIRGPDNRQLFCVYHRWTPGGSGRRLAIDPLDWAGERLLVLGPSYSPEPAPLAPTFADFFDGEQPNGLGGGWRIAGGEWLVRDGAAMQVAVESAAGACYTIGASAFVTELSLRALKTAGAGIFGVNLGKGEQPALRFRLAPAANQAIIAWCDGAGWNGQVIPLPRTFNHHVYHLLRLEVDGNAVCLSLDDPRVRWHGRLAVEPSEIALCTEGAAAAFAGFTTTVGWEDRFTVGDVALQDHGWQSHDMAGWRLNNQQLWFTDQKREGCLSKGPDLVAYELVVNARLGDESLPGGRYGIYPALTEDGRGPLLTVEWDEAGWALWWREAETAHRYPLPAHFDPTVYQQFRFRKENGRLTIHWENDGIGEALIEAAPTRVGLYAGRAVAAFDLVRVTAIP
ncbi:MAG: glycoside hydrolase family 43 protein [Chloroflexi bacterium]|nr:glycoside hydrolase family 43 protein [Chloroflexota bacterium]MCI0574947.1 glycoside hydrolase family 43 protein [Chloroflexota bacterium]MCI0645857.1 glycoside hydrolase family 43 protein [Chloroflexota bacterium]MCI0725712.1 glycoside hydrolase family 43 protein [Chloroflexota bacterium]